MSDSNGLQIPILSELLGGDVPRGRFLVALFDPSADWPSLAFTMTSGLLRQGNVVNLVAISISPAEVRRELQRTIPNLKELEVGRRLYLYDWHTWMTGKKSDEPFSVDSLSVAKLSSDAPMYFKEYSPAYDFALVDNLSTMLKYNDERAFMQWFDRLVARLRPMKGDRLYGVVKGFHSESFYSNIEMLADGVIELTLRERDDELQNAIRIKSFKGVAHTTKWRSLKTDSTGQVSLND